MKKQILFLAIFTLALFAGMDNAFAQPGLTTAPTDCLTPTTIVATCLDLNDGTQPVAGVEYTYTVTVPSPAGTKSLRWWVTTDPEFITGSVLDPNSAALDASSNLILSTGTNYNALTPDQLTMNITWNYFVPDPAAPVYLVVYAENDADCDNNNIEVFIIEPVHSFTLDIAGIDLNGVIEGEAGYIPGPCAAPVASAIYNVANNELEMNYGINYLYFIVTAANFNNSWMPSFQVSGDGIDGDPLARKVTAIDWQYSSTSNAAGAWNASASAPAWDGTNSVYASTSGTAVAAQTGTAVGADGECIIVRVTVDNGYIETIDTEDVISLAVDGIMYDATDGVTDRYATAALGDVHFTDHPSDPTNNCLWVDLFTNDIASQVITVRPDIDEVTPSPFETKQGEED